MCPLEMHCNVGRRKRNHSIHFVAIVYKKNCQFLSLSLISLLSHKRSFYTLSGDFMTQLSPVTKGATLLIISRYSVTLDTQLKLNNSASSTETLGFCFYHYDPCPPLPCSLPNPPGAPVAPHTGPIGGPCPRTGLTRKPV